MSISLTRLSLFQYSLLALPLAFAGLPLYIHAPDFYTRHLGMNIGLIGLILLAVRLFDALQDPLIGYFSDKYASKRRLIMGMGVILLVWGMWAVFSGPQLSIPVAVWFVGAMVLATTGFSIVTINLTMIGGFWSDEVTDRTRISGWREAFALVGLLLASMLPTLLQNIYPVRDAFILLFSVFGCLIVFSYMVFARLMDAGHFVQKDVAGVSVKGFSFWSILSGHDRHFFVVCFLTHLAAALPGVLVLFFIRDYLGAESMAGLFLVLYFVSGAVFMPVWVKLAAFVGKYRAWLFSMVIAILTFIWAYLLSPGDVVAYGVICVLSGIALGADLALPPSILADRVTQQRTENQATQYYALIAFLSKAAIAIAGGVSFLILDSIGFVAGRENSHDVLLGVVTLYALVPCLIKSAAAFYLWRLSKHEGDINENYKRSSTHEPAYIS